MQLKELHLEKWALVSWHRSVLDPLDICALHTGQRNAELLIFSGWCSCLSCSLRMPSKYKLAQTSFLSFLSLEKIFHRTWATLLVCLAVFSSEQYNSAFLRGWVVAPAFQQAMASQNQICFPRNLWNELISSVRNSALTLISSVHNAQTTYFCKHL